MESSGFVKVPRLPRGFVAVLSWLCRGFDASRRLPRLFGARWIHLHPCHMIRPSRPLFPTNSASLSITRDIMHCSACRRECVWAYACMCVCVLHSRGWVHTCVWLRPLPPDWGFVPASSVGCAAWPLGEPRDHPAPLGPFRPQSYTAVSAPQKDTGMG